MYLNEELSKKLYDKLIEKGYEPKIHKRWFDPLNTTSTPHSYYEFVGAHYLHNIKRRNYNRISFDMLPPCFTVEDLLRIIPSEIEIGKRPYQFRGGFDNGYMYYYVSCGSLFYVSNADSKNRIAVALYEIVNHLLDGEHDLDSKYITRKKKYHISDTFTMYEGHKPISHVSPSDIKDKEISETYDKLINLLEKYVNNRI